MNPNQTPAISDHPVFTFKGRPVPLRLSIASVLRLKSQGIDLLQQPPFDPGAQAHREAREAYLKAVQDGKTGDELQAFADAANAAWNALSEERRAWRHPIDVDEPTRRTEIAFVILAECMSDHRKKQIFNYMEVAEEFELADAAEIIDKTFTAAKNFLAGRSGRPQPAEGAAQ